MARRLFPTMLAGAAALGLAGCETWDDHGYGPPPHGAYGPPPHGGYGPPHGSFGGYGYEGQDFGPAAHFRNPFRGPGAQILDPWLAGTPEGWTIVTTGFRSARQGYVSADLAHRINIWFRRYADTDRDMMLTDAEIRVALVQASRDHGWHQRDSRGW